MLWGKFLSYKPYFLPMKTKIARLFKIMAPKWEVLFVSIPHFIDQQLIPTTCIMSVIQNIFKITSRYVHSQRNRAEVSSCQGKICPVLPQSSLKSLSIYLFSPLSTIFTLLMPYFYHFSFLPYFYQIFLTSPGQIPVC